MDEELRRQVEALKAKLHAGGVSDYQRYEAMQILSICPRCGDREGHICLCLNDRTIKLTVAATGTRCGGRTEDCQFSERNNSGCGAFAGLRTRRDGRWGYWYERLPECIAAEKEAGNHGR